MLSHLSLPIPSESDTSTSDEKNWFSLITSGKDVPFSRSKNDQSNGVIEKVSKSFKHTYSNRLTTKWQEAFLKNVSQILGMIRHTLEFADDKQVTAADKNFWNGMHHLFNQVISLSKLKMDSDVIDKHPLNGLMWFVNLHFGGSTALDPSLWQKAYPNGQHKEFGVVLYYMLVRKFFEQFLESIELLGIVFTVLTSYTRSGDQNLALYFPEVWKKANIERSTKITDLARALRSFVDYYSTLKQKKSTDETSKAVRTLRINASKVPLFFVFLDDVPENLYNFFYIDPKPRPSFTSVKKYWQQSLLLPPSLVFNHSTELINRLTSNDFSFKQLQTLLEQDHMSSGTVIGPFWSDEFIEKAYTKDSSVVMALPAVTPKKATPESIEQIISSLKMITFGRNQIFEEKVDKFVGDIRRQLQEVHDKSDNASKTIKMHEKLIEEVHTKLFEQFATARDASESGLKDITEHKIPSILQSVKALSDEKESKAGAQKMMAKIREELKEFESSETLRPLLDFVKKDIEKVNFGVQNQISKLKDEMDSMRKTIETQVETIVNYQKQLTAFKDSMSSMSKSHEKLEELIKELHKKKEITDEEEQSLIEEFDRVSSELSNLLQNYDQ